MRLFNWSAMNAQVIFVVLAFSAASYSLPSLRDSIRQPLHVLEGEDALLTCVVRNLESNTLLWKRVDSDKRISRVLTAGPNRVTPDKRISVLHDSASMPPSAVTSGSDVWVLVVKNARPSDSGVYVCEINSNPILRSFHTLDVIANNLQPPVEVVTLSPGSSGSASTRSPIQMKHNYTDCCTQNSVSSSCLGFCVLKNILDGTTGTDPEKCEPEFPNIVKCMADGRNHVPCCQDEGIPDVCQDICRGEYNIPTDDIKSHVSCSAYTEQTLACVAEGIEILPGPPSSVFAEPLSQTSLKISWESPLQKDTPVTHYMVRILELPEFDSKKSKKPETDDKDVESVVGYTSEIKVSSEQNSTIIENLRPFTMYEITIVSRNVHGESLPSYRVRTVTHSSDTTLGNPVPGHSAPSLPDVKGCCSSRGVYHSKCVDKFCDPVRTSDISLPDLMICAPWARDSFSCLANGMDHTGCCQARGLPAACLPLCSGNITRIDFAQFRCIQYMDDLTNCLLQGYGVLPSPPLNLKVSNINPTFVILRWDVPKTLGKTVVSYNVHYRSTSDEDNEYKLINTKNMPFILEDLESGVEYEVYVSAVNEYGVGEGSSRILFKTYDDKVLESAPENAYNLSACCHSVGISSHCMPLCDYSAKLSDLRSLTNVCGKEFPKLLRCGAGGRNHLGCCERRGIPQACYGFCTGSVTEELMVTAAACIPYLGNVIQCFEEGTGLLPGPIIQLHATSVTDDSVTLVWQAPSEGNVSSYVVHYQEIHETSAKQTTFELDQQMNVTETAAVVSGLKANTLYNFFVLAANDHGTSLPSSVLTINVSKEGINGTVAGVPSAPQGISVSSRSADYLTLTWQQPVLLHPTDRVRYRLYVRTKDQNEFTKIETSVPSYRFDNLTANTQYIMYLTALNDNGESRPSETLVAWTDPAFAPIVEAPTIHPNSIVLEGGSMTVLCIAMGTPMPTVSLYVAGRLFKTERTRHMVAVLSNVTRAMNPITCFAENGYGNPSQASKRVLIGRRPNITASVITLASLGDTVTLECEVDAHPQPEMYFSRDADGIQQIANNTKYQITTLRENKDIDSNYIMQLRINSMEQSDSGVYYCGARNSFGGFTQTIKLQARQKEKTQSMNVAQCCSAQNVSTACSDACTSFLDIDSIIDRPECVNDFHKLMKCAADGSDHRGCCTQWGVPRRCLDWCRGEAVVNPDLCALSYTKQIISCFHEGQDKIPGPPRNLRIDIENSSSVQVSWEAPSKNPQTVELYRVFWRPQGAPMAEKNDTRSTSLHIVGLKEGVVYELVVKAGNHFGTSTLTEPLIFEMSDKYVVSSSTQSDNSHVGVAVGIVVALLLIGCAVAGAVSFLKKKKIAGIKMSGLSFENPVNILRRTANASDTLQIIQNETPADGAEASSSSQVAVNGGWKQETLHASSQSEVPPTLYEELRLGVDGVGFKRLK